MEQIIMVCGDCKSNKLIKTTQTITPVDQNIFGLVFDSKCEDCGSIGRTFSFLVNLMSVQDFESKIHFSVCKNCKNKTFVDIKNRKEHPSTDINSQYFYAKCAKCGQQILLVNYSGKDMQKLGLILRDEETEKEISQAIKEFLI
jgi:RNase P subunit RPR2